MSSSRVVKLLSKNNNIKNLFQLKLALNPSLNCKLSMSTQFQQQLQRSLYVNRIETNLLNQFINYRSLSTDSQTNNSNVDSNTNSNSNSNNDNNNNNTQKTPSNEQNSNNLEETEQQDPRDKRITQLEELNRKLDDRMRFFVSECETIRKTSSKEIENAKKFGIQAFAKDLLDVSDNLKRALECVTEEQIEKNSELKTLADGVKMTRSELYKVFSKHGLEEYNPIGEKFNPNIHSALFQVQDPSKEPGTVCHVMRTGFMLVDRVVRAAQVGVVANRSANTNTNTNTNNTNSTNNN
eukprot:TRINITY_DN131_c0_g1_i1.p1 TRINITY_DN131_c0_g1~~TRINITY_DN131_c0_g1_i1.p1  ORF type:complete len:295 (+),score=148.96 TRINITY_DN131_c0_g1_i1:103-987(+)